MDFQDDSTEQERQAAIAAALRRQEDVGYLAQLSGNETARPYAQSILASVQNQREAQAQAQQQGYARKLSLAKMVADAREKATDNDRQERALAQTVKHETWNEQHPQQSIVFGTQPGAAPGAAPEGFAFNPRTGKLEPIGLTQAPKGGAGSGPNSEKEWGELTKALSTGARGTLAKDLQKSLNSAEGLEALVLGPGGQIQDLTPQQKREAYTALNNLIAKGGSSAVTQIEHLVPETLADKFANAKQYLLNEPAGSNSQALLQNLLDTTAREKKLALQQLRRAQLQGLPNYAHLRGANANRYGSILKGAGIDPASVDESGLDKGAAPSAIPALKPGEVEMVDKKGRPRAVGEADVKEAEAHGWKRR